MNQIIAAASKPASTAEPLKATHFKNLPIARTLRVGATQYGTDLPPLRNRTHYGNRDVVALTQGDADAWLTIEAIARPLLGLGGELSSATGGPLSHLFVREGSPQSAFHHAPSHRPPVKRIPSV